MKLLIILLTLKFGFSISTNWSVGREQGEANTAATNEAIQKDKFLQEKVTGLEALNNSCGPMIPNAFAQAQQIAATNNQTCAASAAAKTQLQQNINTCLTHVTPVIQQMKQLGIGQSCEKIAKTTQISCEASTYAPWVSMVTGQLGSTSSGSMYDKCKKAATLQLGMSTISAGLAATCAISKKKCENTCGKISKSIELAEQAIANARRNVMTAQQALQDCGMTADPELITLVEAAATQYRKDLTTTFSAIEKCEKYELNVMSALMSATQLVQGIAQSQSCQKELAQDECTKPEATQNPACTAAYCSVAANQSAPQCVAIFGECYSANAASNPKCACLQNPMQQSCLNLPPIDTSGPNRSTASNDNSGYNFDEDDTYGAQGDNLGFGDPNSKAPGVIGGSQGGSGGGAGQGNALGGGPGGGGSGGQKGVYDTNVTGGTSAGGGGGGSGGGIAGYGSGASGGYGSGGAGGMNFGKSSLDLKKYLPGGQFAKQREEQDTGITSANGLSNFQKVNRAHNKSRGALVAP